MSTLIRITTLVAALAAAAASQAVVFTDDFSFTQTGITLISPGSSATGGANIASNVSRVLINSQFANDDSGFARSHVGVKNGSFNLSNDVEVASNGAVQYAFANAIDLSGTTGFRLDFLSNDIADGAAIQVRDANGNDSFFSGNVAASLSPFSSTLSFISGNANLAQTKRVFLVLGGNFRGEDLSLDQIQSVPEPASMAALGLGALGLLRRRRKAV